MQRPTSGKQNMKTIPENLKAVTPGPKLPKIEEKFTSLVSKSPAMSKQAPAKAKTSGVIDSTKPSTTIVESINGNASQGLSKLGRSPQARPSEQTEDCFNPVVYELEGLPETYNDTKFKCRPLDRKTEEKEHQRVANIAQKKEQENKSQAAKSIEAHKAEAEIAILENHMKGKQFVPPTERQIERKAILKRVKQEARVETAQIKILRKGLESGESRRRRHIVSAKIIIPPYRRKIIQPKQEGSQMLINRKLLNVMQSTRLRSKNGY